jgi:hypothetical protein
LPPGENNLSTLFYFATILSIRGRRRQSWLFNLCVNSPRPGNRRLDLTLQI